MTDLQSWATTRPSEWTDEQKTHITALIRGGCDHVWPESEPETPTPTFTPWPKIARLNRDIVVTEKIDGSNAAIGITDEGQVYAQSRKRIIVPGDDNFGFAKWVHDNAEVLQLLLGPGIHFGEWWGKGIQRGYGMDCKVFSLFNTHRWKDLDHEIGLRCVPLLYSGPFSEYDITRSLELLATQGSYAAPGFKDPEGVVVFHTAANSMFKVTLVGDEKPKGSNE